MLKFPTTNPIAKMIPGNFLLKIRSPGLFGSIRKVEKLCFFFSIYLCTVFTLLGSLLLSLVCVQCCCSRANGLWIGVYENICLGCVLRLLGETPYCVVLLFGSTMCILRAFKARLIIALGNFKYRGQWALNGHFGDLESKTGFGLFSPKYRQTWPSQ